jgi:hypothetical protein
MLLALSTQDPTVWWEEKPRELGVENLYLHHQSFIFTTSLLVFHNRCLHTQRHIIVEVLVRLNEIKLPT